MPVFMWRKWYCLWRGAASLWVTVNIPSVSGLKSESEYEHSISPLCLFFISPQRQPSGLAHINSCSHKESLLCVVTAPECPALLKNNSLFEDAAINPDGDSLMTSPSLWFWPRSSSCAQTSSTSTGNTPQEANERPPPLLPLRVCVTVPPSGTQAFVTPSHFRTGDTPSSSPSPPGHLFSPCTCSWLLITTGWSSTWSGRPWRKLARTGRAGSRGGCWPCGRCAGAASRSPAAPSAPGRSLFLRTGRSPHKT